MQVVRISLSARDVARQNEPEFQKELTSKMERAGFNLEDPIIRQERSDVYGAVDFIQLQYSIFDKYSFIFSDWLGDLWFKIKRQFAEQKDE